MTSALNWPARESLIDGMEGCGLDGEGGAAVETMLPLLKREGFTKTVAPLCDPDFTFESAVGQH